MLHQPTPRTDLLVWAHEIAAVVEMLGIRVVAISDPFMAALPVLQQHGIATVTVDELLTGEPVAAVSTAEDDIALLQLTSGSTGPPKAVQITHENLVSNAEAMSRAADFDLDSDVIVSWLPCFHDMGMTGFLVVPMYFGAELVKITPLDFLRDVLLWARLIDKYRATMTAAPSFAYALLANGCAPTPERANSTCPVCGSRCRARNRSIPVQSRTSSRPGHRSGCAAKQSCPAYGMAESTVAVSFSPLGAGLIVDEVDADILAALGRAVPATTSNTRRLASLGPPLDDLQARIIDADGAIAAARAVGVIQLSGQPLTTGYRTAAEFVAVQDKQGWLDTGDLGYLTEDGHLVVCGRVKDVIIMAGRSIHPTDIERAAQRVPGVRPGCAVAILLDGPGDRETFAVAVESTYFDEPEKVRALKRHVAHEVVAEVNARPRRVIVLEPGTVPKTPSGKVRRTQMRSLLTAPV